MSYLKNLALLLVFGMATTILRAQSSPEFDIFQALPADKQLGKFCGFEMATFTFNGRQAKVVKPRQIGRMAPWIWRARFWGHEPQADSALLVRGLSCGIL